MKTSRLALALTALSFALLQGCSTDEQDDNRPKTADDRFNTREPVTFVDSAVNADHHFSDTVDATQPNQLVVPTAGNEDVLAKISVGTVLAGDRDKSKDGATSKNPFGFLRKVKAIKKDGANTVIETDRAELDEWIKNGDLYYNDPKSLFSDDVTTGGLGTQTLHLQDQGGASGGSVAMNTEFEGSEVSQPGYKIKPKIGFSNAALQVNANFDGYFRVRSTWGFPTGVKAKSLLTFDPYVGADIAVGIKAIGAEPGVHIGVTPGISIAEKVVDLPGGMIVVPTGPIPFTVRFFPRVKCSLGGSGEVTATVRAELRAHAAIGFEADAGFGGIDTKDLSEKPTLSPTFQFKGGQVKATLNAQCEIAAVVQVLAFDAVGLSGEAGPYIGLNADGCINANMQTQTVDGGFTVYEQHGLGLQAAARLQVPIFGTGKDFPLLTVAVLKSDPKYLIGDAQTCALKQKDSCNGRTDGFYCSVENPYSGIVCQGGQIARGLACATTQKCIGGTTTEIRCGN